MSSILCIFKHKWNYRTETITYYPPKVLASNTMFGTGYYGGPCDSNGNPLPVKYDRNIRMCERCKKKEREDKKFIAVEAKWSTIWMDCELTQSDIRDNKLEELGI